jgi:hypothetical protein
VLLAAAVVAGIDVLGLHCRLGGAAVAWIARRTVPRDALQFQDARFACCQAQCGISAELTGVRTAFATTIDRARFCSAAGLTLEGLVTHGSRQPMLLSAGGIHVNFALPAVQAHIDRIAVGGSPPLAAVDAADFNVAVGDKRIAVTGTDARGIRVAGELLATQNVSVPEIAIPRAIHPEIGIPRVTVGTSAIHLERRRDGTWSLPALADGQATAADFQDLYNALMASYTALGPRLQTVALWLLAIALAITAAAKLALTFGGWAARTLSAAGTVGVGCLAYFAGTLGVVCLIVGGAVALYLAIYRKAPEWHRRLEPLAADLIGPVLIILALAFCAFVLPPLPGTPARVAVAHVDLGAVSVALRDESLGSADVSVAGITADGISAVTAPLSVALDRLEIADTSVASSPELVRARVPRTVASSVRYQTGSAPTGLVSLHGVAESPMLQKKVRKIGYLPDSIRNPAPSSFCVNWKLGTELPDSCGRGETLSLRGSADLSDPAQIRFAAESVLRALGAAVLTRAAGSGTQVQVTEMRSLPSSALQIGGGSGTVDLGGSVRARFALRDVAAAGLSAGATELLADAASLRQINASGAVRQIHMAQSTIDSAAWDLHLAPGAQGDTLRALVDAKNLRISGADPAIDAEIPRARAGVSGTLSAERFDGALASSGSTWDVQPVRFSADLFAGAIHVPDQHFEIGQTAASFFPSRVSGKLSADAGIRSLTPVETDIHSNVSLDAEEIALTPVRATLRSLHLSIAGASSISFDSAWGVAYPSVPQFFDLRKISTLRVSSEGSLHGIRYQDGVLPVWKLPAAAPDQFRVGGSLAGPLWVEALGGRLQIGQATASLKKLTIRGGRIEELGLNAQAGDFSTSHGVSGLTVATDISLSGSPAAVAISGNLPGAAGWSLRADPQRVQFTAQEIDAAPIWRDAAPILQEFGVVLDGLHPAARVRDLHAELGFPEGRLAAATGSLEVLPGALASLDLHAPLRLATAETNGPIGLRLSLAPAGGASNLTASVSARSTRLRLEADGGAAAIDTDLEAELLGSLSPAETSRTPIADRLASAVAGLRPQADAAIDAFGGGPAAWNVDAAWKLELGNTAPNEPALQASPERWSAKLDFPRVDVSFGGTRVQASGQAITDLVAYGDALILDGRIPATVEGRKYDIPILAAFTGRAPAPAAGGDLLWDPAQFAAIWDGFQVRNASAASTRVLDRGELTLGNFSFRSVRIPVQPVPVTVAYTNPLRLSLPLSGLVLAGTVQGFAQAELGWTGGMAAVTSRVSGKVENLQTDGFELLSGGTSSTFLADAWDAGFAFRVDDLRLNRERLAALLQDPLTGDLIDRVSLRLDVSRSLTGGPLAYLQSSSAINVPRWNILVHDIVRDLEIKSSPEALQYNGLHFALATDGDRVVTQGPLLTMHDIAFHSRDNTVGFVGDLRVHLSSPQGTPTSVRGLIEMLRSFQ